MIVRTLLRCHVLNKQAKSLILDISTKTLQKKKDSNKLNCKWKKKSYKYK